MKRTSSNCYTMTHPVCARKYTLGPQQISRSNTLRNNGFRYGALLLGPLWVSFLLGLSPAFFLGQMSVLDGPAAVTAR